MSTTHVIVLDKSGSMFSMGNEPIQAINEYIKTQKENVSEGDSISMYTFGTSTTKVWNMVPMSTVPEFEEKDYKPNGMTALHDAIYTALSDHDTVSNGVMVIITDGEENASIVDSNGKKMRGKMKEMESEKGWKFVYLGASQDVIRAGKAMGMNECVEFDQTTPGDLVRMCRETSNSVSQHTSMRRN